MTVSQSIIRPDRLRNIGSLDCNKRLLPPTTYIIPRLAAYAKDTPEMARKHQLAQVFDEFFQHCQFLVGIVCMPLDLLFGDAALQFA